MRVWGDPTEYNGIQIHPIQMGKCTEFYECVPCLLYEKNKAQDIRIIKMSYLDFLFALIQQDNTLFYKLTQLLDLILLEQKYEFTYLEQQVYLHINGVRFDGFEFEKIKNIILEQNSIEHKEEFLDPDLEKELQEAEEFMSKKNGTPATLEERIIALHCLSGAPYREIKNYTIFQFNKTLERFAIIKNFEVYTALLTEHGASTDVQHWLCHIEEKGKYDDVIMSKDEFDKITSDKELFKS